MCTILYYPFGIPDHSYHPPALMLVPTPPACVDSVTPWQLCQEDMALTVPHLLGFCSFLYVQLSGCGANDFPFNGM